MAESMRGTRLGFRSYESDAHVALPERQAIAYVCESGHTTVVPFSAEAEEIPYTWSCRCGREATRPDVPAPAVAEGRHQRTHWDMLLERRSIGELEALLQERLALLRHTVGGSTRMARSA